MKRQYFDSSAIHHIYERAIDKGVIFYTLEDRLVYMTTYAAEARKHSIKVIAASIMFTHTHQSVYARTQTDMRKYLNASGSSFSRRYNFHYCRTGPLFSLKPGKSQKRSLKDKRSNIIYVFNNHTEKELCSHAIDERWSFLPYCCSDHPFSEPISPKTMSKTLKKALRLVDRHIANNKGLNYAELGKILPNLDSRECEQFIDYTISHYNWIDFSLTLSYFGSVDSLCTALASTTGGEYDIREDYLSYKDIWYAKMLEIPCVLSALHNIWQMQSREISQIVRKIDTKISVPAIMISKFFHKSFQEISDILFSFYGY